MVFITQIVIDYSMSRGTADNANEDLLTIINTSQTITVDTNSPYHLHPFDHPGLIFVTHSLSKNGKNYFTWRRSFLNALQSKNKVGFVDGRIKKLDVNSVDFQPWMRCNAIVLSWLMNALAKEI
ncbi:Retrotransposon Copia-like [Theobroma cacao]|nr:Retrotransposon Copia-like [Theobroma cacao]